MINPIDPLFDLTDAQLERLWEVKELILDWTDLPARSRGESETRAFAVDLMEYIETGEGENPILKYID